MTGAPGWIHALAGECSAPAPAAAADRKAGPNFVTKEQLHGKPKPEAAPVQPRPKKKRGKKKGKKKGKKGEEKLREEL